MLPGLVGPPPAMVKASAALLGSRPGTGDVRVEIESGESRAIGIKRRLRHWGGTVP